MSYLHLLNNLKIPPHIKGAGSIHWLEMHGFLEASMVSDGLWCMFIFKNNE